jgi:hypothetical protein
MRKRQGRAPKISFLASSAMPIPVSRMEVLKRPPSLFIVVFARRAFPRLLNRFDWTS